MKLKIIMLSEKTKEYVVKILFTYNFRKCKLIYHDRKQINGCLGEGWEEWQREIIKRYKKTSGGDIYVHLLDCGNGFTGVCMSKLVKLYTLNMCRLLYVNYASIKLLKIKEKTMIITLT